MNSFGKYDEEIKLLKGISFGLMSPDTIRKLSKCEVKIPDTYDDCGYPIQNGLMDPSMGVIDPGLICKTCGKRVGECPGHFGHIELTRPVLHIGYITDIYLLLKVTCRKCGRLLCSKDELEEYKILIDSGSDDIDEELQKLISRLKKVKVCPHCGEEQYEVKLVKPYYFYEIIGNRKKALYPNEIRNRFEKIPNKDLQLIGFNPYVARPEWTILTCILVPPVTMRPSIILESGDRSEDDLTHKLGDIIRINQRLAENIAGGAPTPIIEEMWTLLQYHVATFFTNEISGVPAAKHRSGKMLKTIYQRIKGKEGRIRKNLSGKRVNFSARTSITPDPRAKIDELYIPRYIAEELTFPEYVNEENIDELKNLILSGKVNYVKTDTGHKIRILENNREKICELIGPGWIVYRQMRDGDIVLFNRQPSLHRVSILSFKVKIKDGKTLSFNDCVANPFNADFDGDEMNVHFPQTVEAITEAEKLLNPKNHIIGVGNQFAMISLPLDMVSGLCLLTMDEKIDRSIANKMLALIGLKEKQLEDKEYYSGKELYSLILPKGFNFKGKSFDGSEFVIEDGKLVSGIFDGKLSGKIIMEIHRQFGADECYEYLNRASWLGAAYVTYFGMSIGLKDVLLPEDLKKELKKKFDSAKKKIDEYIKKYKEGTLEKLPGKNIEETIRAYILDEILSVWSEVGEELIDKIDPRENNLVLLIKAKMKGKKENLMQMGFNAGLFTVRGKPVSRGYRSGRVLPYFKPGEISLSTLGFSEKSLSEGLDFKEYYYYCMSAVDSLIDKGVNTASSGYLYRRLVNSLMDLYVDDELRVKDSFGNIIQFIYGGDGVDPQNDF